MKPVALHPLHHLLHALVLLQELVELLHRRAGTAHNATLSAGVEDLRSASLLRRH